MVIIETAAQPIKSLSHFNVQSAVKAAAILFPPCSRYERGLKKRNGSTGVSPRGERNIS